MQFTQLFRYDWIPHLDAAADVSIVGVHYVEPGVVTMVGLSEAGVNNWTCQVYSMLALNNTRGDLYTANHDSRRFLQEGNPPITGVRAGHLYFDRQRFLHTRWNFGSWYFANQSSVQIRSAINSWYLYNPTFKALSTSELIFGNVLLVAQFDDAVVKALRWKKSIMEDQALLGDVQLALDASKRAGSLCVVGDLVFVPIVTVAGDPPVRSADNVVSVYRFGPGIKWSKVADIDVSALCEGGSAGIMAMWTDGKFFYFVENGCAYPNTPYETPVQVIQCVLN